MRSLDVSPFVVHKAHLIDTVVYLTVGLLIALAPLCYDIHQRMAVKYFLSESREPNRVVKLMYNVYLECTRDGLRMQ